MPVTPKIYYKSFSAMEKFDCPNGAAVDNSANRVIDECPHMRPSSYCLFFS